MKIKSIKIKEKVYFQNNGAGFGPMIGDPVIVLTPAQYKNKALRGSFESGGYKVEKDTHS